MAWFRDYISKLMGRNMHIVTRNCYSSVLDSSPFDICFCVAFLVLTLSFIHKEWNSSNILRSYQQSPDVATHPSLLPRTQLPLLDVNSWESWGAKPVAAVMVSQDLLLAITLLPALSTCQCSALWVPPNLHLQSELLAFFHPRVPHYGLQLPHTRKRSRYRSLLSGEQWQDPREWPKAVSGDV